MNNILLKHITNKCFGILAIREMCHERDKNWYSWKAICKFFMRTAPKKLKQCFAAVDWIKAFIKNNEGKNKKESAKISYNGHSV